jgi:hypothetical protein
MVQAQQAQQIVAVAVAAQVLAVQPLLAAQAALAL